MLKKRVVAVVTVRDGRAVQSFGYRRYLPLGRPECLVENLDRWGADEILVQVIDRSSHGRGPDFDLLSRLGSLGLETPLIYAGGVASADDAVRAIQCGADRIAIDQVLHQSPDEVKRMSEQLGAQALIASLPVSYGTGFRWMDYVRRRQLPMDENLVALIRDRVVSELMLVDWANDGGHSSLEPSCLEDLPVPGIPLIMFGGFVDIERSRRFLQHPAVVAVAVGNIFSYREHAYQRYKRGLAMGAVREAVVAGTIPVGQKH